AAVMIAGGLGSLCASFLTPPMARRVGGWRWLTLLLVLGGLAVAVFGPSFTPYMLAAAVFVINLSGQGTKIVVDTDLQHECADDYRGRVFSLTDTAFNASFVLGLFGAAVRGGRGGGGGGEDTRQPDQDAAQVPAYERV